VKCPSPRQVTAGRPTARAGVRSASLDRSAARRLPGALPARRRADPRIHVLTLVESVSNGGAEHLAVNIAARLDPARFRSTVCLTRDPDQLGVDPRVQRAAELRLAAAGARVIVVRRRRTGQLTAWRPLIALLLWDRPTIVHGHMFGSNVWATVLGRAFGVRCVVLHDHRQADPLRTATMRLLTRHLLARASDAAIGVSQETGRQMHEQDGFDPERVHVILNGVPAVAGADGRRIRAELGIGSDDPVVASVTMLRPAKAVEVLIDAAAMLAPRLPGLRVLVAGDGEERARLEALIAERGLGRTVTLLGMRPDVDDILAAADVAALASDIEGTPLAVMEYMEARVPIVATRVGGTPELLEDGVHGLLVAPRDPAALAGAIAGLLGDRDRGRGLAAAAHARKRALFDVDGVVRRVERLYEDLLVSRSAGRRRGR
jgi:glycosyltransferase involved in cell wall biosynthesis